MHRESPEETTRLAQRYEALSDLELLALQDEFDELTDEAQYALKAELRSRRLAPPAQTISAASPATPNDYEFKPLVRESHGLVYLTYFASGIDLALACGHLNEANIDMAVEEPQGEFPVHHILVAPEDVERAKQVLRDKMSLFPLPETDAPQVEGKGYIDDGELLVLAQFEEESERDQTVSILESAGIECEVSSGDPGEYDPIFLVEVRASDFNRALELVSKGLGVE